jgi:hypothetical protein
MTAPARCRVYPYLNGGRPGRRATLPPLSQPDDGPGGDRVAQALSAGSVRWTERLVATVAKWLFGGVMRPLPVPVRVDESGRF